MPAEPFRVGLIGRGIGESRSPRMHEREAAAQGLLLEYTLFDFTADRQPDDYLPTKLDELEAMGFAGTNVTHPFKQAVIEHMDSLSTEAEQIGAVNTVAFRDGRRIGYNTDVSGFAAGFRQSLDGVATKVVVQLGAGGAGSATAFALLNLGVRQLAIYDTDAQRARMLSERLTAYFDPARVVLCEDPTRLLTAANGIVNTTPVGMAAHPGMPIPEATLREDLWVADVIYFPLETQLLAAARRAGCRVMDGSGMAIWQAVGAFEIFTGHRADAARMTASFLSFDRRDSAGDC
jgi:shikimate dehydrogenase